ncbi:MAG TPA: hypothetical protein PKD37_01930 [Oligoflexia bacterium]|nr:hypothetical protein [Oligoflexia bacterium]HMP26736.1 hypothetical protein [Oligoflexia bacterium]
MHDKQQDKHHRGAQPHFPFVLLPAHGFSHLNWIAYNQAVEATLSPLVSKQQDLHKLELLISDPSTSDQSRKKALDVFYNNSLCLLEEAPQLVVPILREHYTRHQASMDAHYLLFAGLVLSRESNDPKNWPLLRKLAIFIISTDDAELMRYAAQEPFPIMESCRPIKEIFSFSQRHSLDRQLLLAYASGLASELRFAELSKEKKRIIGTLKCFQSQQVLRKLELPEEQLFSEMLPDCFFEEKQLKVHRLKFLFSTSSHIGSSYSVNWPRPYEFDPLHWMTPMMYFTNYLIAIKEEAIAKKVINYCCSIIKEKPEIYPQFFLKTLADWRLLLNKSIKINSPRKASSNSLCFDSVGAELSVSDLPEDLGSFKFKLLKIGSVSSKFNSVDASYDFTFKLANFDLASFDFKINIPVQVNLPIVLTILDPITQNQMFFLINQASDRVKVLVQIASFLKNLKLSYQTEKLVDAIDKFINTKNIFKVGAHMEAFNILYSSYQSHALNQSIKEQNLALLNQLCSAVPFNIVDFLSKDLVCFFPKNPSFSGNDLSYNQEFFYQLRAVDPSQDHWELSLVECYRSAGCFHVERIEYRDFRQRGLSTLAVVKRLLFNESSED